MSIISPFDLHEIRTLITDHLDNNDICACTIVCQEWQAYFSPFLWRNVVLNYRLNVAEATPFLHRTRRLDVHWTSSRNDPMLPQGFTSLRELNIHEPEWHFCSVILHHQRNGPLTAVSVQASINLIGSFKLWTALSQCRQLRFLKVSRMDLRNADFTPFWEVCSMVETLEMDYVNAAAGSEDEMLHFRRRFTRLRHLSIHHSCLLLSRRLAQFHPWIYAPSLETLRYTDKTPWSTATLGSMVTDLQLAKTGKEKADSYVSNRDDMSDIDLSKLGQELPFKNLTSIEINGLSIPDGELATIVENADMLHKLSVPGSQAGPKTFDLLHRHFDRIVELNVRDCPFDSKFVLTVMENSPRLQILSATQLAAQDIIQSGTWACTRLRRLQAEIVLSGKESETDAKAESQAVFERLSVLSQLEALDMQWIGTDTENSAPVLSAEYGLGCLSTLQDLRA